MLKRKTKITPLDIGVSLFILALVAFIIYRLAVSLNYNWNWGKIVPQYLFRYDEEKHEWVSNLLMRGLYTTIRLSIWGTILAIIIGGVMGVLRTTKSLFNRMIARTYVELIRNMPPLVLIFIFYYFVSDQIMPVFGVEGFVRSLSPTAQEYLTVLFAAPRFCEAFASAVVTIGIFEGAYITEIIRAGIQSIEKGQWEASHALGLTWGQQMRHIIMPQATRRVLPPLASQFISTIKDSSIVSIISIQELTFMGMEIMSATQRTIEVWMVVTVMYMILTLSLSMAVSRLETVLAKRDQTSSFSKVCPFYASPDEGNRGNKNCRTIQAR